MTNNFYSGKVRDMYRFDDKVIMVTSNRISAFDVILGEIPGKGAILNDLTEYFLNKTKDIAPNWFESRPHPNVIIGKYCKPIMVEMIIRGYLVGHAWREYRDGKRELCGVPLPDGMKEGDKFLEPIITPTTKAVDKHDEDITPDQIFRSCLCTIGEYRVMEKYTRALFQRGTELAEEKGLTLLDTKFEFGIDMSPYKETPESPPHTGRVVVIDEILTPDSSRYLQGDKPLSKEFVRDWLRDQGFTGQGFFAWKEDDPESGTKSLPKMPTEFVQEVADKYRELACIVTGTLKKSS